MSVEIVSGNLLDAKETLIAHQCNCFSSGAAGIAAAIFDKYPHSNVYKDRKQPSIPGTIDIRGNGKASRFVVNMFAQIRPGGPYTGGNWNIIEIMDTAEAREAYFRSCLLHIGDLPVRDSIAFPYGIGCGLGGGSWTNYSAMIEKFAKNHPGTKVVLYKLKG